MEYYENEPEISHYVDADPFDSIIVESRIYVTKELSTVKLIAQAKRKFGHKSPIVWCAEGRNISKGVKCVEIMKTQWKHKIYQNTQIREMRTIEIWNPIMEGLDPLQVTREVPIIFILLSLEPLEPTSPGYQVHNSKSRHHHQTLHLSQIEFSSSCSDDKQQPLPNANININLTALQKLSIRSGGAGAEELSNKSTGSAGGGCPSPSPPPTAAKRGHDKNLINTNQYLGENQHN